MPPGTIDMMKRQEIDRDDVGLSHYETGDLIDSKTILDVNKNHIGTISKPWRERGFEQRGGICALVLAKMHGIKFSVIRARFFMITGTVHRGG